MPDNGTPDYQSISITYAPSSGIPMTWPHVTSAADCPATGDGWYFDDPTSPTQIILCASTCTSIQGEVDGRVDITLGVCSGPLSREH